MGPRTDDEIGLDEAECRARFSRYFPRLFAYVHSFTEDQEEAKKIAAAAFAVVFSLSDSNSSEHFSLTLFSTARELCRRRFMPKKSRDGLSAREREVVSLVFDAEMSRQEISSLLRMKNETVGSTLMSALKKLRTQVFPAATPALAS